MDKKTADKILKQVTDDYNQIARHFSATRTYLSDDLREFKKYTKTHDKILDLGCGNGRLSELFPADSYSYIGADVSKELIKIAKERYPQRDFIVIPSLGLPFKNDDFDIAFCLAVFHHLPGNEYRAKFIKEIHRVLKPDGLLVLTTWDLSRLKQENQRLDSGDLIVPFRDNKGRIEADRYIHTFTSEELENIIEEAGFIIKESGLITRGKHQNFLVVGRKLIDK